MRYSLLAFFVLLGVDGLAVAGEPEELVSRIRAGQAVLRSWEMEIPAVHAEREMTIRGKASRITFDTYHNEGSILVAFGTRRMCLTPKEAFSVERNAATGQYALRFQTANKPETYFQEAIVKNRLLFHPLTAAVQSSTVIDVLDREGFKAESVAQNGIDSVTLHYTRPLMDQGDGSVDRGAMTFSKNHHYLLTRFEYELPLKGEAKPRVLRVVMTRAYTVLEGRPVVTEATQELTSSPANPGDNTTKVRYTYPAQGASPDEFRLEHYLVPPHIPDVYEDRPRFNWRLWGALGMGCIATSVILAWYARRKRQA